MRRTGRAGAAAYKGAHVIQNPATGTPSPTRTCIRTRIRSVLSVMLWPAAIAVWLLHITGAAIHDETDAGLLFCWLVAAGALELPLTGLRLLGPHLTARVCRNFTLISAGASAVLTIEYATDQLHPSAASLYASLALPMAAAVHSRRSVRFARREHEAYQRGLRDGRAQEAGASEELDRASLDTLDDDLRRHDSAYLRRLLHAIEMILAARDEQEAASTQGQPDLHVVREDERRSC